MTWENVNVHAPPESTGPLRRLFKKDDKPPERKHIIQNGEYLYQGKTYKQNKMDNKRDFVISSKWNCKARPSYGYNGRKWSRKNDSPQCADFSKSRRTCRLR